MSKKMFLKKDMNYKYKKGFTLIEVLTAISIFSTVMIIIIGALLMLNNANKKAQALRAVVDNLNFAIEDMTRNIKTGSEYACGAKIERGTSGQWDTINMNEARDCVIRPNNNFYNSVVLKGSIIPGTNLTQCYLYYFLSEEGQPKKLKYATAAQNIGGKCFEQSIWTNVKPNNFISPEVLINDISFNIINPDMTVGSSFVQQPLVIINLSGEIDTAQYKFKTPFNIQTTVSQRNSVSL